MDLRKHFRHLFDAYRNEYDYMEIRLEKLEENMLIMKNSNIDKLSSKFESGGNVRVLKNGGWGFAVFQDMADLDEMVNLALQHAAMVGKTACILARVQPVVDEVRLPNVLEKLSLREKVGLVQRYSKIIDSYGKPIAMSQISLVDKFSTTTFANSEGTFIIQDKFDLKGRITIYATKNGLTESNSITFGSIENYAPIYGLEERIVDACRIAAELLDAPRLDGGEYTVILDPDMAGLFVHEAFGHLSEADILTGNPNLQEAMKIGRVFGSPDLHIYDAALAGRRGSTKYDDEGVPMEKTYLIKNGVLVGRLHSRETAGMLGEDPTGNARAVSYKHPPIIRMRTTSIEGGKYTFSEIIRDVKEGVYAVKGRSGMKNGSNFSLKCNHGYIIHDGKLGDLVKGFTLTGDVFRTLANIDMIGADEVTTNRANECGKNLQVGLAITHGGPHIRIQNVIIGGGEADA